MPFMRLPPLTALRAFEAAARHASFKAAAEELLVTPTAISHQVKQLEDYLGLRVLDRSPRHVKLTPRGVVLCRVVASGFGEIERVVAELRAGIGPQTVTLSSTTAFLTHWLVPRLEALYQAVPAIDLRLHTSNSIEPLKAGGIDVAIRYGTGPFPGVEATRLAEDAFIAVCSPSLGVSSLSDLRGATLLHVDGRIRPAVAPGWPQWCAQAGIEDLDTGRGLRFPDSTLAIQSAIAGQGVAIVSRVLVADALSAGLLVSPFGYRLTGESYYFVCAESLGARSDITDLRAWFQEVFAPVDPG